MEKVSKALILGVVALLANACSTAPKAPPSKADQKGMLIELAQASLAEGDPTGALRALAQAEGMDSDDAHIHHLKALAFNSKKLPDDALREVRIAIKLAPNYSDAKNTYGKILLDQGRYEEALPQLQAAASDPLYAESFKPLTSIGILYYRRGNLAKAREYLLRATDEAPDATCIANYYLGHISLAQSRLPEAIRNYAKATKKNCGNFADAHVALGMAYERDRKYDMARKTYLDVEKEFPNSKSADQAVERLRYLP